MPASRRARAMIFAPRSCPSRPGLATTTRIFLWVAASMRAGDPIGWSWNRRRRGSRFQGVPRRGVLMLLACSLAVLALAGTPAGGRHLETTIQDDGVLLSSAP